MSDPRAEPAVRVLWLEDDLLLRRAIQLIAGDLGVHLQIAASREEAERWLSAERFDWIICDYQLATGTSAAFVRARLAEGHRVAVVTGDASRVDPTLAVRILEKPFRLQDLMRELAENESPPSR